MSGGIHLYREIYFPTRWSIFERIRKQIINNLIQITLINEHFIRRRGRDKPEVHFLGLGGILETQINFIKERYNIGFFQRKSKLVILHSPKLKQLINKSQHALCALIHDFYRIGHFFGYLANTMHLLQSSLNQRQRSTKLMGDIGKEYQLVFRKLFLHFDLITQIIHVANNTIDRIEHKNYKQKIKQISPSSTPERRRNDNPEHRILIAPLSCSITCFYMQIIDTRFQIFIGCKSQGRRNTPFFIIPFQFIAELWRNRSRIIQRRKVYSERILVISQMNVTDISKGIFQR